MRQSAQAGASAEDHDADQHECTAPDNIACASADSGADRKANQPQRRCGSKRCTRQVPIRHYIGQSEPERLNGQTLQDKPECCKSEYDKLITANALAIDQAINQR